VPDAEVVAVGSRKQESADEFGNRFNIPKRYASYEDLAKDPNVEIVYVSTLHPLHKDNSLLCLNHGKAVLSEKPLTINAKEAEEVIKVARAKKLFYMEGMWTRFFPAVQKLRELISDGSLGDIKLVQADFGFKHTNQARLLQEELGGGGVLDIGVYPISLASLAFGGGAPSKIQSSGTIGPTGVDYQASLLVSYGAEQVASLSYTLLADCPREATVIGTKGRVRLSSPFWCTTQLIVTIGDKTETLDFPLPPTREGHRWNFQNSMGMHYEGLHVQKMLLEGRTESTTISLDESLVIMKTMDEVRRQLGVVYSTEKQ